MTTEAKARCKRVTCVDLDTTYSSTKLAAEALGVRASNITAVLKGRAKTAGGLRFEYATTIPAIVVEPQTKKIKSRVGANCKRIFCDQNARFYSSIAEAAQEMKIPPSNISACLNDRRQAVKGNTFYYVSEKDEPSCYTQEEGEK